MQGIWKTRLSRWSHNEEQKETSEETTVGNIDPAPASFNRQHNVQQSNQALEDLIILSLLPVAHVGFIEI